MLTNHFIYTGIRQKSRLTLKSLDFIDASVFPKEKDGLRSIGKKSIKSKTDFVPVETHSNLSIYQRDVEPAETPDTAIHRLYLEPVETHNTETDVEPVETPDTEIRRLYVEPVETHNTTTHKLYIEPVETHSTISIYQMDVEPVETHNTKLDVEPVETPDTTTHRLYIEPVETHSTISIYQMDVEPVETHSNLPIHQRDVEPVETPYTTSTYKPTKTLTPITSN
jgi:hypothetical protein